MYKRAFVLFVLPIYNWIIVWMGYSCRETIRKLRDAASYFDWRFQLSLRSVLRSALRPMLRFVASVSASAFGRGAHWTPALYQNKTISLQL